MESMPCHAIDSVKHNLCSCQLHAIQFLNSDFVTGGVMKSLVIGFEHYTVYFGRLGFISSSLEVA